MSDIQALRKVAGRRGVQSHVQLHGESRALLSYMTPYLKFVFQVLRTVQVAQ